MTSGASPGPVSATLAWIDWRDGSRRVVSRRVPPGDHGLKGVGRQVAEDLEQGRRRHRHRRQVGIEVELDANAFCFGGTRREPGGLGEHGIQVARNEVLTVGPGKLKQSRDDLFQSIDLVNQSSQRFLVEPDDTALPELGGRPNAGQRIAHLVGDARQELAQCREPLAAPQFDLQPVALGGLTADGPSQPGRQAQTPAQSRPSASPRPAGNPEVNDRRTADRPGAS